MALSHAINEWINERKKRKFMTQLSQDRKCPQNIHRVSILI